MIKSFGDKLTKELFEKGKCRGIKSDICKKARIKLEQIHLASSLMELTIPPSNHLEKLKGNLKDYYSIRINKQYVMLMMFLSLITIKEVHSSCSKQ